MPQDVMVLGQHTCEQVIPAAHSTACHKLAVPEWIEACNRQQAAMVCVGISNETLAVYQDGGIYRSSLHDMNKCPSEMDVTLQYLQTRPIKMQHVTLSR